eukprot:m.1661701 g.1661701  ORF g.1661701 m.1661701 type:complete len:70 (-) comp126355_c0_seq1:66-275(-)
MKNHIPKLVCMEETTNKCKGTSTEEVDGHGGWFRATDCCNLYDSKANWIATDTTCNRVYGFSYGGRAFI